MVGFDISRCVYDLVILYLGTTIINIIIVVMIIIYHTTPLQFLKRRSQQFSENQNIKNHQTLCVVIFLCINGMLCLHCIFYVLVT